MNDTCYLVRAPRQAVGLVSHAIVLLLAGAGPTRTVAQQPARAAAALVFDGVTVVDVETGELLAAQRVVVTGTRIRAVGVARSVPLPKGARVIDAQGKYLIPGLWDLHFHGSLAGFDVDGNYASALAFGVTGVRDPSSPVPLDTLRRWHREALVGTRVGPPRQIYTGPPVDDANPRREQDTDCYRKRFGKLFLCVADAADARHVVDSLKAAGADMIKTHSLDAATYFAIAAEARRIGIPFGGHVDHVEAIVASDSGARIIDHPWLFNDDPAVRERLYTICMDPSSASVARCQVLAEHFRRNDTWWVPTLFASSEVSLGPAGQALRTRFMEAQETYLAASVHEGNWLRPITAGVDSLGALHLAQRVGVPILAGTDPGGWGYLHGELAIFVAEGLTPLTALQSATLNPAKMWHATDSLGTVAPGKLADLVLLDANPLEDITNTTTIRAVVANGRYLDRAALDSLLAQVRANQQLPQNQRKPVQLPKGP